MEYITACIGAGTLLPPGDYPVLPPPVKAKLPPPAAAPEPTAPEPAAAAAVVKPAVPRRAVFKRLLNFGALGLGQPRWVRDYQLSLALSHLRVAGRKRKQQRKASKGVSKQC